MNGRIIFRKDVDKTIFLLYQCLFIVVHLFGFMVLFKENCVGFMQFSFVNIFKNNENIQPADFICIQKR